MNRCKVALVPVVAAASLAFAPVAHAQDWDELAQCESSGDWSIETGNGYSGGLQFSPSTWAAFGGTEYAANAADATREQQIAVAERVLAEQGPGAWPACSESTGWESGGSATPLDAPEIATDENTRDSGSVAAPKDPASSQELSGSYTVQSGDTLGSIAAAHGMHWSEIHAVNDSVTDPHLIYPGQVLTF